MPRHERSSADRQSISMRIMLVVAELMVTFGLLLLFFLGYQLLGKPAEVTRAQDRLDNELERTWHEPARANDTRPTRPRPQPEIPDGKPFTRLSIPTLESSWTIVEGVSPAALRGAPGHYPDSSMPGEPGNFAVAGHRSESVFLDLDELSDGDAMRVETRDSWFTYRVYAKKVVSPDAVEVIGPNPDQPGKPPNRPVLTLTTCDPWYSAEHRLIIHAELVDTDPKVKGG